MRDRQALENLNRAAHRGHAIICAFDAVLSGLSLMGVAFSEYVAEGTCPDIVILRVPRRTTDLDGHQVLGLLCGLDLMIWWRVSHSLVPSAGR